MVACSVESLELRRLCTISPFESLSSTDALRLAPPLPFLPEDAFAFGEDAAGAGEDDAVLLSPGDFFAMIFGDFFADGERFVLVVVVSATSVIAVSSDFFSSASLLDFLVDFLLGSGVA